MSGSDEMTFRRMPDYWDAIIKELKEVKARVGKIEARMDTFETSVPKAPPTEETEVETELVEEVAEL